MQKINNLKYLSDSIIKFRTKMILIIGCLLILAVVITPIIMFNSSLIYVVLLITAIIVLSRYLSEIISIYGMLTKAKKLCDDILEGDSKFSEETVNDFIDLLLLRQELADRFKSTISPSTLDKISITDKKIDDFVENVFYQHEKSKFTYTYKVRSMFELHSKVRMYLYAAFDIGSKRRYFEKWYSESD